MFGGTLTLRRDFNMAPNQYRGEMSLHPEISDTACSRRSMYRGNRNIKRVGLGEFNNSMSTPRLLENARENVNDLPHVGIL